MKCSIADASVYPASIKLHNETVNMIANLWHAPKPSNDQDFVGAGTVGSTEGESTLFLYFVQLLSDNDLLMLYFSLPPSWIGIEVPLEEMVRKEA